MSRLTTEASPAAAPVRLRLLSADGLAGDAELSLAAAPLTIGRGAQADLRICDRWVSREHCRLERLPEGLFVRDLGSNHGTYLNGRAIDLAPLAPGDRLGLGMTSFIVEYAG